MSKEMRILDENFPLTIFSPLDNGFTKHYGISFDGYEKLLCYRLALKPDSSG